MWIKPHQGIIMKNSTIIVIVVVIAVLGIFGMREFKESIKRDIFESLKRDYIPGPYENNNGYDPDKVPIQKRQTTDIESFNSFWQSQIND